MTTKSDRPALCPSARAEPGAAIIGVVGPDGRVGYLKDWLEIDQPFLDAVNAAAEEWGLPEQRYRFANRCVEGGCKQWNGSKCTVLDQVAAELAPEDTHSLPPCAIRTDCRWFRQSGPDACRLCPLVITETV